MTILGKHVIMKETLIVIISGREGSAPMVEKTIRRHPERMRRICTRGGENGKMLFNIKKPLPLQETVFCFQSGQVIAAILSIA